MRGNLNLRFLSIVAAATAVFAVGWFFLHRYQKSRKVGEYLVQVARAEQEEKPDRAARLLRAYILLCPTDADAKVRYGEMLEKHSPTKRAWIDALGLYEQVLQQEPGRHDTRRRAAELALGLGRVDAALDHLAVLQEAFPGDGKVLLLTGRCLEARSRHDEAAGKYDESRKADPKPEAFVRLAAVYRGRLKRPDDADKVMNELVERAPDLFQSYLARADYSVAVDRANRLAAAAADAEKARQLAPDQPEVLLLNAGLAMELASREPAKEADHLGRARGYLVHGLEKAPRAASLYLLLADLEARGGQQAEAVQVLRRAQKLVPPPALPEVLFATADHCTAAGDVAGTDEAVAQLRKLNQPPVRIDFAVARSLVKRGMWSEGSAVLERIRPLLVNDPDKSLQTDLLLATCYGQMGDTDRQVNVYNRAVAAAPIDPRPRLGLAGAYAALGRVGEAASEYERVTRMPAPPAGAWLALAQLKVYQNLTQPEAERRWEEVTRLLDRVQEVVPDAAPIPLLRAEVLVAQGKTAEARKLLTAARDERPKDGELWYALAVLADRDGDRKGALDLLDEAGRRLGDSVDLRLARIRLASYESPSQANELLDRLTEGADRFPPDEQTRLLRAAGAAYWAVDKPAEAGRLWEAVARLRPTELQVRMLLFDVALRTNDEPRMERTLDEIRRIEGDGPLQKYGQATRLIWRAGRGDRSQLAEARTLLTAVGARRPGWSRVPLGLARIDDLDGDTNRALEAYKLAVQYGDRQPSVVRRLVQLLYERQQYAEADDFLRRLQVHAPISGELTRLAAEVSLRTAGGEERALELGRKVVSQDTKDFRERVWLGQLFSAAGRVAEAEKEFERASALAPDQPDPLVALVQHHVRRKETEKAEAAIRRAEGRLAGGARGALALAQCDELVGHREAAEVRLQAAVRAHPREPQILRGGAEFHQRSGTPDRAEPLLRALLSPEVKAPAADIAWARRNLALALGLKGDDRAFGEALGLLDQNTAGGETVDDLRVRAAVLAVRPRHRREAVALLEKAEKLQPPQPNHEFLLAQLYEVEGAWPKARDRMFRLVGLQKDNKAFHSALVGALIRRGEWSEAEVWVGQLREIAPHESATVRLQTRVWLNRGRTAESVTLIREFADAKDGDPADPAARALAAGDLMDLVSLAGPGDRIAAAAAEQFYSRYRDLAKSPAASLPLAAYYGRHNDPDKALAVCEQALKECPVEQVAAVAAGAVGGDKARDDHYRRVDGWLSQALSTRPESDLIRFQIATLRERQQRYAEAEAGYRTLMTRNPDHVGVLNNLAILLALTGKSEEAVELIRTAMNAAEVSSDVLLDTRGIVLTAAGRLDDARKDFEAAAAMGGGSAATQFHRAVLFYKQRDKQRTVGALKLAREKGLQRSDLHPLEQSTYNELVAWAEKP